MCFCLGSSYLEISGLLGPVSVSFPRVWNVSVILFSNNFPDPFLSSPSGTPIILILLHLILSQRSLKLSSLASILIYLASMSGYFPLPCLPAQWFMLPLHLLCCWTLLGHFSVITSVWYLYFLPLYYLFTKILGVFIHSSPQIGEHLYDHYFEFLIM